MNNKIVSVLSHVKAEGLTAIECWVIACIIFVFGALLEYTVILLQLKLQKVGALKGKRHNGYSLGSKNGQRGGSITSPGPLPSGASVTMAGGDNTTQSPCSDPDNGTDSGGDGGDTDSLGWSGSEALLSRTLQTI